MKYTYECTETQSGVHFRYGKLTRKQDKSLGIKKLGIILYILFLEKSDKMIIGLFFYLKELDSLFFSKIFNKIDVTKYAWSVNETQIWSNVQGDDTFQKELYDGKDFQKIVFAPQNLIMQGKLKAFTENQAYFDTFDEYLKSSCEFMFFIYDCHYMEIYCKSQKLLKIFEKNIKESFVIKDFIFITDTETQSKTGRYSFSIV